MVHGPVREVVRGPGPLDWSTDRGSVFSGHPSWVICLHSFNLSVWVEFIQRSLSEKVLKANLSYTRHFFRHISFVEEIEGECFICSYDVSR